MVTLRSLSAALMLWLFSSAALAASDAQPNVNFSGDLVADPCTLAPDESNPGILVEFGTVIIKSLYSEKRSLPEVFSIHLIDCDTSLGNTVHVLFTGTEDTEQPGLLAIEPGSAAKGIAIGLQTLKAEPIAINSQSPASVIVEGDTTLQFAAFVQASDNAIAHQLIEPGTFSAVATFEFVYD